MTTIPEGSIIITPTEVYNEVKSLTEVVRKMVAQDDAEKKLAVDRDARFKDLETRVGSLERKVWLVTGAAAAAGAGLGTWLPRVLGT